MREIILAAKSRPLSCKISPGSLVAPGHFMNVVSKRNSGTSTVLPLLSTLALRHCCAGPRFSPASQLTVMVSAIAPAGTVVSVSALLDPEISTFLYIKSLSCFPTNIPESSWCQSGQLQMRGGTLHLTPGHGESELFMFQCTPDFLRVLALSKLTLSDSNIHRIRTLVISFLFSVAVAHITQWLVRINFSIKVFWKNGWVQWELDQEKLKGLCQQLKLLSAHMNCAWLLLPSGWVHTEGSSVSITQSYLAKEPLQSASHANEPKAHCQAVGQEVTAILFPILNNAQLCHPITLARQC